jgi:hypothetical protein
MIQRNRIFRKPAKQKFHGFIGYYFFFKKSIYIYIGVKLLMKLP